MPGLYSYQDEQRQRMLLVRVARSAFVVLVVVVTLLNILKVENNATGGREVELAIGWWIPLGAALLLSVVVLAVDLLTPNKKISTISGVFFGLLAGMLATYALGFILDLLAATYDVSSSPIIGTIKVLVGISLCYLGVTTVLHTQDDFRLVIPYVEFAKQIRGPKPLLLDSSALVDARIVEVAGTGIVQSPLVIPHFVVAELHMLADSGDRLKRAKGRRGLDIIAKLQRSGVLDVTIDQTPVPGKAVDQMLIELAKRMPGNVVTTDVALARIAQIQGVGVLNLHELANAMRPALIPGEQVSLRLIKPGEQPGQGVGYLDDGTMLIVEGGAELIGQEVQAEVTSSLQTSAGRLIFSRLSGVSGSERGAAERRGGQVAPAREPAREETPGASDGEPDSDPASVVDSSVEAGSPELSLPDSGLPEVAPSEAPVTQPALAEPSLPAGAAMDGPPAKEKPARSPFPPKPPARGITGRNPRR